MHISETTVKRPVLAAVLSLFVILIGLASYDKLTIREYPCLLYTSPSPRD